MSNERRFDLKWWENESKMLYSLNQVSLFEYDHNFLHQFLMLIYHTTYAYMYLKKERKHYKNELEFRCVYQDFKNIFWFI